MWLYQLHAWLSIAPRSTKTLSLSHPLTPLDRCSQSASMNLHPVLNRDSAHECHSRTPSTPVKRLAYRRATGGSTELEP